MDKETDILIQRRAFNRNVIHLSRLHHMVCEKRLSRLQIHRSQHMLLMHIAKSDTPPSQKELAEHLEISPAAVAVSLKKLEAEGYITRKESKGDNRIKSIGVTPKGLKIVTDSRIIFDSIDTDMFEGIDEDELLRCMATLEKLQSNIKKLL